MKQLIFISLFILIGWEAECQTLVADETTMEIMKTIVKIQTDNDTLPIVLLDKYERDLLRYTVTYKKDRHGRYKQYTFYWPIEKTDEITLFLKNFKR